MRSLCLCGLLGPAALQDVVGSTSEASYPKAAASPSKVVASLLFLGCRVVVACRASAQSFRRSTYIPLCLQKRWLRRREKSRCGFEVYAH